MIGKPDLYRNDTKSYFIVHGDTCTSLVHIELTNAIIGLKITKGSVPFSIRTIFTGCSSMEVFLLDVSMVVTD